MADLASAGRGDRSGVSDDLAKIEELILSNGLGAELDARNAAAKAAAAAQAAPPRATAWLRAFSLGERSMTLAIALIIAAISLAAGWSVKAGLMLAPAAVAPAAWIAVLAAAVVCACAATGQQLDGHSTGFARLGKRITQRLQLVAAASLLLLLLGIAATVLAHLTFGMSDGTDLRDAKFIAADRRLGFDWTDYIAGLNRQAAFGHLLITVNSFAPLLIAAPVLCLGLSNRRRRLAEFICASTLASLSAILLQALLPTAGGYVFLRPDASLFASLNAEAGRALTAMIEAWHSMAPSAAGPEGAGRLTDPLAVSVALAVPGLQAALAVIALYALRRMPLTAFAAAGPGLLFILAPLNEGGQYLSQLVLGVMLAAGCILSVQTLRFRRVKKPVKIVLRAEREADFLTWEKPTRAP